jgi:selenide,water dikinase
MWGQLSWQGRWAWHWKDHIDRKFVARYREPAPPAA